MRARRIYTYTHTRTHTHTHRHSHTRTRTSTHTHPHTHTPAVSVLVVRHVFRHALARRQRRVQQCVGQRRRQLAPRPREHDADACGGKGTGFGKKGTGFGSKGTGCGTKRALTVPKSKCPIAASTSSSSRSCSMLLPGVPPMPPDGRASDPCAALVRALAWMRACLCAFVCVCVCV